MPKYVVSSTLTTAVWTNTTILRGETVGDGLEILTYQPGIGTSATAPKVPELDRLIAELSTG
jgi:hypothetical protein